jgi:hypothetical protein
MIVKSEGTNHQPNGNYGRRGNMTNAGKVEDAKRLAVVSATPTPVDTVSVVMAEEPGALGTIILVKWMRFLRLELAGIWTTQRRF